MDTIILLSTLWDCTKIYLTVRFCPKLFGYPKISQIPWNKDSKKLRKLHIKKVLPRSRNVGVMCPPAQRDHRQYQNLWGQQKQIIIASQSQMLQAGSLGSSGFSINLVVWVLTFFFNFCYKQMLHIKRLNNSRVFWCSPPDLIWFPDCQTTQPFWIAAKPCTLFWSLLWLHLVERGVV